MTCLNDKNLLGPTGDPKNECKLHNSKDIIQSLLAESIIYSVNPCSAAWVTVVLTMVSWGASFSTLLTAASL